MSIDALIRFYETLSRESVARIAEVYTEDACFKDPFNEVRGIDAVRRVFAHMFEQVEDPRFEVTGCWIDAGGGAPSEGGAILAWDFRFGAGGQRRLVHGLSHVRFAADGRVDFHRDYWDPAEGLYEQVPVLGALMRAIKRRLRAS